MPAGYGSARRQAPGGKRRRRGSAILLGRDDDQGLNAFETDELWVEPGTPRVHVSTDGEVSVMDAPLHYKIRPRALRVVAPGGKPAL